jgi:cytochrome c
MRALPCLAVIMAAATLTSCGTGKTDSGAAGTGQASSGGASELDSAANRKLVADLGPAYAKADLANGQVHFALCRSCHTIANGGPNMTGPNLYGLFGRKSGSLPGYSYSEGMKAANIVWNAETLNSWIKEPKAVVAGTKMSYPGMPDDKDRADLIAYLKVASSGGAN